MGLVGRLHEVELDRQSLHSQLRESKEECERLSGVCTELQETRQQVETLQSEVCGRSGGGGREEERGMEGGGRGREGGRKGGREEGGKVKGRW